jgi:hypothetical protein
MKFWLKTKVWLAIAISVFFASAAPGRSDDNSTASVAGLAGSPQSAARRLTPAQLEAPAKEKQNPVCNFADPRFQNGFDHSDSHRGVLARSFIKCEFRPDWRFSAVPVIAAVDWNPSSDQKWTESQVNDRHLNASAMAARRIAAATASPGTPSNQQEQTTQTNASASSEGGAPTQAQLEALQKESQNPVGNIAVLPFQSNWNYAAGPTKTTVWNLNIQPVVPVMLSPRANLIERVIMPVVNITPLIPQSHCLDLEIVSAGPCGAQLGISNIQLQSYYAPKTKPGALIWGAGPIFSFPTVTQHLGTQQFGGGIDVVGLTMPGHWVIGSLFTQRWYIAGPREPSRATLNEFLAQPFINFNFGKGWTLAESPIITANWNAPGSQKWTVPIGLGIVNTNTWLKLPMQYQLAYYGNVVRPQFAPYGLIRFSWSILWPVKRGQ